MEKGDVTFMKIGELAQKIHVSRIHAWRLAKAGIVPGARRTKGGHFFFPETSQLKRWINLMIGGAFRKKEMSRAYSKCYGINKEKAIREERSLRKDFKRALKMHKGDSFDGFGDDVFFNCFILDIVELTQIFSELDKWRKSKIKTEIRNLAKEEVLTLRGAIDQWLKPDDVQ